MENGYNMYLIKCWAMKLVAEVVVSASHYLYTQSVIMVL